MTESGYVEAVKATRNAYSSPDGSPVGNLTPDEDAKVRELYAAGAPLSRAVLAVAKLRGLFPGEPDPRRPYGKHSATTSLPPHDDFGRSGRPG